MQIPKDAMAQLGGEGVMITTPTLAFHTSGCGKRLVLLAALTGLIAFRPARWREAQPPQGRNVRVMTYNMSMGNVGKITTATSETLPRAVAEFFNDTVATEPSQRAAAIAKKIYDKKPDLVAPQGSGHLAQRKWRRAE